MQIKFRISFVQLNQGETTLALVMNLRVIACGIAKDVVDGLALFLVFFG